MSSVSILITLLKAEVRKQVDLCLIHEREADSDDARLAGSLTQALERRGITCVRAEPGASERQLAVALSSRPSAPHVADFLRTALPRLLGARTALVLLSERSSRFISTFYKSSSLCFSLQSSHTRTCNSQSCVSSVVLFVCYVSGSTQYYFISYFD